MNLTYILNTLDGVHCCSAALMLLSTPTVFWILTSLLYICFHSEVMSSTLITPNTLTPTPTTHFSLLSMVSLPISRTLLSCVQLLQTSDVDAVLFHLSCSIYHIMIWLWRHQSSCRYVLCDVILPYSVDDELLSIGRSCLLP